MPVGRRLDLKGKAQPEQAPNVELLVPALSVAHGGSNLEQAVASQHHEDRGKELADHALLDRCYWQISRTLVALMMAGKLCRLRSRRSGWREAGRWRRSTT